MTDTKKLSPASGAQRLAAYRRRLLRTDLVRAEILLPKAVRDAAQEIAKQEDARYLETVSALAQLGLETYQTQSSLTGFTAPTLDDLYGASLRAAPSAAAFMQCANAGAAITASVPTASTRGVAPALCSPLARFLKNRKESIDE